jgi:hypothetical protein
MGRLSLSGIDVWLGIKVDEKSVHLLHVAKSTKSVVDL